MDYACSHFNRIAMDLCKNQIRTQLVIDLFRTKLHSRLDDVTYIHM
jgi:hypothetical protein